MLASAFFLTFGIKLAKCGQNNTKKNSQENVAFFATSLVLSTTNVGRKGHSMNRIILLKYQYFKKSNTGVQIENLS